MWEDSALLTIVVVGVPCLIISMICYALFCLEISDEFISEHEINEGFETDEEGIFEIIDNSFNLNFLKLFSIKN